jgi:hypothetical protein
MQRTLLLFHFGNSAAVPSVPVSVAVSDIMPRKPNIMHRAQKAAASSNFTAILVMLAAALIVISLGMAVDESMVSEIASR